MHGPIQMVCVYCASHFAIGFPIQLGYRLSVHSDSDLRMSEVTRILEAIQQGDAQAADELLPLVTRNFATGFV